MTKNILILEDNKIIRDGIKVYLEEYLYKVTDISKISQLDKVLIKNIDLFILDINLPDGTAYELVEEIKLNNKPIIFLTVRNSDEDIIKGLEVGGDDYITKPFKLNILKARIETVLRRYDDNKSPVINIDNLKLDTEANEVYIDKKLINLTSKEYEILELFLKNIGKTLSRDYLIENYWDNYGDYVNDNTLSVTIARLREKLGSYSKNLKTIRGLGYRFDYEK